MNYRDFFVWLTTKENLSLTSASIPLHYVTSSKKDVVFQLLKPQLDFIESLRNLVISATCLRIFNSKLSTHLGTDASSLGLRSFLKQNYGM